MQIAKLLLWSGFILGSINAAMMILTYEKEKAPFIGIQLGAVVLSFLFLIIIHYDAKKEKR